jgi:D-3-phosphoglycerate dehydrogenase
MKLRAAFFDFDSTVVTKESLDEVISLALRGRPDHEKLVAEIEEITKLGMEGKLPFTKSVERRIRVAPLLRTHFLEVGEMLTEHITEGMQDVFMWLRDHSIETFIVSGGIRECILPAARTLRVPASRCFTNEALFSDEGAFSGMNTESLLWNDGGKTAAIKQVRVTNKLDGVCALVGDGSNDLSAYVAGIVELFCGFGANVERPSVRQKAPHWANSSAELLEWLKDTIA